MTLDDRAYDFGVIVEDIIQQFQTVNGSVANGPHVELNHQELRLVEFLGAKGPQMMRVLAEHLALAVNSVTTVADRMEQKGLISRQRSEEDRRVVRLELTEAGQVMYRAADVARLQFYRTMLGALTVDEQEILLVLFRKIARAGRGESLPSNSDK